MSQGILPLIPPGATAINEMVSVVRQEKTWTYFLSTYPIYSHPEDDHQCFRSIIAQLINNGSCKQCEVVGAFGISKKCAIRAVKQIRERGIKSFFEPRKSKRSGAVLTPEVLSSAQNLLNEQLSRKEVAEELGVKLDTLKKAIHDGRLQESEKIPGRTKSERSVEDAAAAAGMGTACTRTSDRVSAALGVLCGAATSFDTSLDVPCGGVLCALPALLANGLLRGVDQHLSSVTGYYTQFHILLLLGFTALCRIKTVEQLGGKASGEFGILLGLDRCPEVRCLRNKMAQLAGDKNAENWAAELARFWMEKDPDLCGYLYVDGHIGVYHGGLTKLPRRYVSRERLCLRGISNYWVNDALGAPFFVVEKQIDSGLQQVLRDDIVPRLLHDIPNQPSAEELQKNPYRCRFVLVFDREGYSPELFREMWEKHRIGCMTYHKYPKDPWPEERFVEHEVTLSNGEVLKMSLAEMGSLVGSSKKSMWMRELRKLSKSGHQSSIIATVFEPALENLAPRMFTRWCQENYFRYMMKHFDIDLIPEYGTELFPGTEKVVNPEWRELKRQRNSVDNKLRYRRARFTAMSMNPANEKDPRKYEKWERKKAEVLEEIQQYEKELETIKAQLKDKPNHITWEELPEAHKFERLPTSRKRLTDTIKMIAYRAETAMANILRSPTISTADARAVVRELCTNEADILPDLEAKTLTVSVHGAANPATNRAILKLLDHLNQTETVYPGTDLRLHYKCGIPDTHSTPAGGIANSLGKDS